MNTQMVAVIYGATLHLIGVVAVTVALVTGHIDQTVGVGFLGTLLGIGIGVPVTVAVTNKTPDTAAAPPS